MVNERSYHFSCGNSSVGPIGFCASVRATSEQEALEVLRACLPEEVMVFDDHRTGKDPNLARVEYVQIYLNPDAVAVADIDDDI